ncbi:MAG: hypothetical protein KF745_05725 [Phycisphaeraceae bacterium]|nr:hypothetical protein [Phycisphaeraceae bacterium]
MGLFDWLRGRTPAAKPQGDDSPAHAVLLYIRLSDDAFGTDEDRAACFSLEDDLQKAVAAQRAGEYDGNEFGEGLCVIFMYGPDAESLWSAIEPALEKRPFRKGSYAIRRFGPPGAREERIDLHWDG